jgi:hypothetical protein
MERLYSGIVGDQRSEDPRPQRQTPHPMADRSFFPHSASDPAPAVWAACRGNKDKDATYAFFRNPKVSFTNVREPHIDATCCPMTERPVVLWVQDTTDGALAESVATGWRQARAWQLASRKIMVTRQGLMQVNYHLRSRVYRGCQNTSLP